MPVRVLLVVCLVLLASVAHAHPGHGADGGSWSLGHLLGDPAHLALALAFGLGAAALLRTRRPSLRVRRPRD